MNYRRLKMANLRMVALWLFCLCSYMSGQSSWTTLQGPPKARDVKDVTASSDGSVLYSADKSVLFKSTNSGSSWSATSSEISSPLVVVCKPSSPDVVVVGKLGVINRSTDGGSNWDAGYTISGITPLRLALSPLDPNQMYLGVQSNGSSASIKWSTNAGSNWNDATTPPSTGSSVNDIAPYPVSYSGRSNDVWAGSSGSSFSTKGVWKSTNCFKCLGLRQLPPRPTSGANRAAGLSSYQAHLKTIFDGRLF